MNPHEATPELKIAVAGGGFSGLSAALRLIDLSKASARPLKLVLLEARPRAGGLVQTERRDGYLIEHGADSFITNRPGGIELCRRLGLESGLIGTNPEFRKSFILRAGRPVETPRGYQLVAPTRLWPLITTPLLSWQGKLRVAIEPFIRRRASGEDESLADFARRRFGPEALERIIQPMAGGIYTSDPERLSMLAAMRRFVDIERKYGSVIHGLKREARQGEGASGARYALFVAPADGMSALRDAAVAELQRTGEVRENDSLVSLAADGPGWRLNGGERFHAVVLALPAWSSAELVLSWHPELAEELNAIEYASSAIVVSGHSLADIDHPLDGAGLVIPQVERRRIMAVSFASRKFPGRAPEGRVLLRTFIGGAMQPELLQRDDARLKRIVLEELREILGVRGQPDLCEVFRYERGMPQYHVGHLERVARIEALARRAPCFALCGNAYEGVGLPNAIDSGKRAAEMVWNQVLAGPPETSGPLPQDGNAHHPG